jgi:hypothetical protein
MSRPWRIEFKGALYHVLSRGNEQKDIFWDDEDRNCFIRIMGEMSDRFDDIFFVANRTFYKLGDIRTIQSVVHIR